MDLSSLTDNPLNPPRDGSILNDTLAIKDELDVNFAGLSLMDPLNSLDLCDSPRVHTVTKLWQQLQKVRVLHIRGTPTSGKSKLAILLESYILENFPEIDVFCLSWPGSSRYPPDTRFNIMLKEMIGQPDIKGNLLYCSDMVLIIDECQNSYQYESLWNDFIKIQASGSTSGPCLALFSSYGSPGEVPIEHIGCVPIHLSTQQRVSLRPLKENNSEIGLYLTKEEFMDVIGRASKYGQHGGKFLPSSELVDFIWNMTSGHPGGTRAILDTLLHCDIIRPFLKSNSEVSLEATGDILGNDEKLFKSLTTSIAGFKRSLPKREKLWDSSTRALLYQVLVSNSVSGDITTDSTLNKAYKSGWLQAELSNEGNVIYFFPTMLHRRYYEYLLLESYFPSSRFPTIQSLVFAAIRRFSARSLRSVGQILGPGATIRPVEAKFQDEIYRSCHEVLGNRIFLKSEWIESSSRQTVFWIKSKGWVIGVVHDGIELQEHIDRFLSGGKYHRLVVSRELSEYIVIDFRPFHGSTPPKKSNIPFLIYAVFSKDFSICKVLDSNLIPLCGEFAISA